MSDALDRLLELEAEATEGPWDVITPGRYVEVRAGGETPVVRWPGFDCSFRGPEGHAANARFIAVSRNVFRALVEEVKAWRANDPTLPTVPGGGDPVGRTDAAIERALGGGDE